MRKSEFRDRTYVYGEIIPDYPPYTRLILHATVPENAKGRVIKLKKETVQKLKQLGAWRQGLILLRAMHYRKIHNDDFE
ncbi:MAG: hypothetical protein WD097_04500 [Balneolales bacterium]